MDRNHWNNKKIIKERYSFFRDFLIILNSLSVSIIQFMQLRCLTIGWWSMSNFKQFYYEYLVWYCFVTCMFYVNPKTLILIYKAYRYYDHSPWLRDIPKMLGFIVDIFPIETYFVLFFRIKTPHNDNSNLTYILAFTSYIL